MTVLSPSTKASSVEAPSSETSSSKNLLLQTQGLTAHYGDFQALFGIDLRVEQGQTVSIIGANGAGKSTLMSAICGLMARPDKSILFNSQNIASLDAAQIVSMGIAMVPEGRRLFPSLTVEENLLIGAYSRQDSDQDLAPWNLENIYQIFPILEERKTQAPRSLSGGQQQMVAIGRALMSCPQLLLCDEISLGLAPAVIKDIYEALPLIKAKGTSIILVEQDINRALNAADYVYCLQEGRVTLQGAPAGLGKDAIHQAYFGSEL